MIWFCWWLMVSSVCLANWHSFLHTNNHPPHKIVLVLIFDENGTQYLSKPTRCLAKKQNHVNKNDFIVSIQSIVKMWYKICTWKSAVWTALLFTCTSTFFRGYTNIFLIRLKYPEKKPSFDWFCRKKRE